MACIIKIDKIICLNYSKYFCTYNCQNRRTDCLFLNELFTPTSQENYDLTFPVKDRADFVSSLLLLTTKIEVLFGRFKTVNGLLRQNKSINKIFLLLMGDKFEGLFFIISFIKLQTVDKLKILRNGKTRLLVSKNNSIQVNPKSETRDTRTRF